MVWRSCNRQVLYSASFIVNTLNSDTFHISEHYRIILHSLPKLATTVLWGVGGVAEGSDLEELQSMTRFI